MALAVYSDPQAVTGYMLMCVTVQPLHHDCLGLVGGGGFIDEATVQDDIRLKELRKAHILEMDRFYTDRNPQCDAELSDEVQIEWEEKEINEYFSQMEGNAEVAASLKNTAIHRFVDYFTRSKEYQKLGMDGKKIDEKIHRRLHGGRIFEVSCNTPGDPRGETYYFTTREDLENSPCYDEMFLGYWTSEGYLFFNKLHIPYKTFEECGNSLR